MNYDHPELRDHLCAEYALGTLRGAARRRFERLMAADRELRAHVSLWKERLAHMAWSAAPEARVPAHNWSSIQARIDPKPAKNRNLWNSLPFWRGVGLAASVLTVALLILPPDRQPAVPDIAPERIAVVSELGSEGPAWIVTAAADGRQIRARAMAPPEMPEGDVCVLWLVWPDGTVQPVGVLPEVGEMQMAVPAIDRAPYQARVTVTIERSAQLPMSSPAGPPVFSGPWLEL